MRVRKVLEDSACRKPGSVEARLVPGAQPAANLFGRSASCAGSSACRNPGTEEAHADEYAPVRASWAKQAAVLSAEQLRPVEFVWSKLQAHS
jgi:hypothetical protein